jgi:hypothetical protein
MNEWQLYDRHDKHQTAFTSLLSDRGQQIAKKLGYKQATEMSACLNCHALSAPTGAQPKPDLLAEGVTCVACHGPFIEWVDTHPRSILYVIRGTAPPVKAGQPDWTKLDRKTKERDYGMTDLWDPIRRAETCVACHVGNYAQGKVVTHAMYAAGHPPLPGFEAATFSDAQPRHWEYMREKSPLRQKRLIPPPDPRNLEQTRLAVINTLVALRESMQLFADQATANKPEPVVAQWPDFARFDCYACHHELQAQSGASWRQVRHRDGRPGRPASPAWSSILIELGIEAAGKQKAGAAPVQLQKDLEAFHDSLNARPFGDRENAAQAARKVAASADALLKNTKLTVFDHKLVRHWLDRLCDMAGNPSLDYDSARQIAWAFRIMYHESLPKVLALDPVIEHALDDLDADLALALPSAKEQVPIGNTLPRRLKIVAEFDAGYFHSHFDMIAKQLPEAFPAPAAGN